MNVLTLIRNVAGQLNAIDSRRLIRVSSDDSRRSCDVDLTCFPEDTVLIRVDDIALDVGHIGKCLRESCDCGHRGCSGSHFRCDYLAVYRAESKLMALYIEVKTGNSRQQKSVAHGFKQILCSKVVFETVMQSCVGDHARITSVGVVVLPAFELSPRNQHEIAKWSIDNGLRLIQVKSGEDLWTKCMAS